MTTEHEPDINPVLIDHITDVLYQMGEDWTDEHCPDLDEIAKRIFTIVANFVGDWYATEVAQ